MYNVCLKLDEDIIESVTKAVNDNDGPKCIIQSPFNCGDARIAIIKSICGNIIHSLIAYNDHGDFVLPGFEPLTNEGQDQFETQWNENYLKTSHMDHVTYVCNSGESKKILEWYHEIFSMKRFLVSPQVSTPCDLKKKNPFQILPPVLLKETLEDDGIEIPGEVNMRLTVGEWLSSWMCREEGAILDSGSSRYYN